jgi:protein TonB
VEPLSLAEPEITLPPLPELAPPRFPTPPVEAFIPAPDGEIPPLPNELTPSPRPVETVPPPQPTETRKAERRRIDPPKVAKRKPVPRKAEPDAQPKARGETGNGEAAANRAASARGGTQGASATAGTASITSYRARIVAHLSRFKTYPEQARDRGIQGRNSVTLTIGRDGRVISAALAGASGHSMLDAATLAAVRRATPFPAMPDGSPPTLTVTIGLNYDLR